MRVFLNDQFLRVEVLDGSPAIPAVRPHSPDAGTGRGLRLLSDLSTRWGVDSQENGKAVWFEIPATTGTDATAR